MDGIELSGGGGLIAVTLSLRRLMQKDFYRFKASLGYPMELNQNIKNKKKSGIHN